MRGPRSNPLRGSHPCVTIPAMTNHDDVVLFIETDLDQLDGTALALILPERDIDGDTAKCWLGPSEGPWRLGTLTRWGNGDAFQIAAVEPPVWYEGERPEVVGGAGD